MSSKQWLVLGVLILSGLSAVRGAEVTPLETPDPNGQPLSAFVEADQQRQWEDRVNKRPSWKTLVANKRMALGGEHPRFAHSRRTSYCYYLLSHGRLVSSARYAQMLEELSDPKLHHKFAGQLDRLAPKATVFRESGTWRNYHSDSVMVLGTPWRNYILVALVESANSEKIIQPLLPQVEALLHAPVSNATLVSSMRT